MSGYGPTIASLPRAPTYADLAAGAAVGVTQWCDEEAIQYVRTSSGWKPSGVIDPANASATYYVSSSGSAHAAGTSDDPLSSLTDVATRIGDGSRQLGQVFVNVLDSLATTALNLRLPCAADGLHFMIISGARTVLLTTTIGAITQWQQDATHNTVGTIAGASSIATYGGSLKLAGKMFRVTSGAYAGAIGILGAVESGANVLFVPPQVAVYTPGTVPLALNDTVEILGDPPSIAQSLTVHGDAFLGLDNVAVGTTNSPHGFIAQNTKILASHCLFRCGVDIGAAGAIEGVACAFDDTVRTYGVAGDGGSGEIALYGCHTQAIEVRPLGKAILSDVHARGALSISHQGSVRVLASSWLFLSATGTGTGVTMGQRACLDVPGVLNGRSFTASPAVLAVGFGAALAYSVKPYFGSIGGTAKLYAFDGSTSGVAADLPAAFSQNGAAIAPRTY